MSAWSLPSEEQYHVRVRELRAMMREDGIDILVTSGSETRRYLGGVDGLASVRPIWLVLPLEGQPEFVTPRLESAVIRDQSWIPVTQEWVEWEEPAFPSRDHLAALSHVLRRLSPDGAKTIGSDFYQSSAASIDSLRAQFGTDRVKDASGLLIGARLVKDGGVLDVVRRGAEIAVHQYKYTSEIAPLIGPGHDIPAPDVGTDEQTMAWMMDTYSVGRGHTVLGVVTGKPVAVGGSLGRSMATSRGVVAIALQALDRLGIDPVGASAAVQGFGKVGRGAARLLADAGMRVVAVSDVHGAVYNATGLDVTALEDHVEAAGTVVGFGKAQQVEGEDVLCSQVDLLIPAAVEGVIHGGNAAGVQARVVVEGANGPVTPEADRILVNRGVMVVPDILANAGGVVVSYFEWVQANQSYWWSEAEVDDRLVARMIRGWDEVTSYADEFGLSLRLAATCLAVERVFRAHELRGLYP